MISPTHEYILIVNLYMVAYGLARHGQYGGNFIATIIAVYVLLKEIVFRIDFN